MTVRVLLADDHTMLRQSLRRSLVEAGIDVVAEAGNGLEAVKLAEEHRPDVVLMDVSMPQMDGIEATRQVRSRAPGVQVVILTMHAEDDLLREALRSGAVGYMVKDCTVDEIVDTITRVAGSEEPFSPEVATSLLGEVRRGGAAELDEESLITKREIEVLQLVAEGATTSEVGARLYISIKTVKNHLSSIYRKLDAHDRTQAVLQGVRSGIIRLE